MSSKKWFALFCGTVLLLAACLAGFNWLVDPFGVFHHKLLEWPSHEMTMNPRTAKVTYLEEHHDEYDSYILGCSSTSSYPIELLNDYLDASFYNMLIYGADMKDTELQAAWLLENYEVKNLIVNVYLSNTRVYDEESNPRTYAMPPQTTEENAALFSLRYFFMDPRTSLEKLRHMGQDTELPQGFDCFNEVTGAYDKTVRDAEAIGDLASYLARYPVFADYPESSRETIETAISGTLESVGRIKAMCEERGVNFLVFCAPVYAEQVAYFDLDQVADFYDRLAQVTDYWDFSYTSASFEPRFYYDESHFHNCVGKMALARVFGDDDVYIPEDFGFYVTAENAEAYFETVWKHAAPLPEEETTAQVPILLYHQLDETGDNRMTLSVRRFEAHLAALQEAGYTAITIDDLTAYVYQGIPLPEKPVLITFDDGYLSSYTYAWPLLAQYGMKATFFVVGSTIGEAEQDNASDDASLPHFSWAQAREMTDSGIISLQSHTYDLHPCASCENTSCEDSPAREGILRREGESEEAYRAVLAEDAEHIRQDILAHTGQSTVRAIAYPHGLYDTLAQVTVLEHGYDVTFSTDPHVNTLIKGHPQSLLALGRYRMNETITASQLLRQLNSTGR